MDKLIKKYSDLKTEKDHICWGWDCDSSENKELEIAITVCKENIEVLKEEMKKAKNWRGPEHTEIELKLERAVIDLGDLEWMKSMEKEPECDDEPTILELLAERNS